MQSNDAFEKEGASMGLRRTDLSAADSPSLEGLAEAEAVPIVPIADAIAVQVDMVETLQVVAPSNLPDGYHLDVVDVDGRSLRVQVPMGGVTSGESFHGIILRNIEHDGNHPTLTRREQSSRDDHVPIGNWRNGLFDCCMLGLFHPVICLGLWAPPVALGQVMTRLNLNGCAEYQSERDSFCCSAFRTMLALYIVTSLTTGFVGQILESFFFDFDEEEETESEPGWVVAIIFSRLGWAFFYYVFVMIVAIRTRAYARKRYKIKTQYGCGECEDVCCVLVCYPCVVCQLSTHTVDYENQQARCCTDTGLKSDCPMPV
eukprot:scaffold11172_cov172-Amphora_coffeaeformis.AAC.4